MNSITLNIGGVATEITIKDFNFEWIEVFWGDGVSITGRRRNTHRGFQPVLELSFENDTQLNAVAKSIYDAISSGQTIQYEHDGVINIVPESFQAMNNYKAQIARRPSTLVLEGDIQGEESFIITGILCGYTHVFCGQTNILCGV